MLDSLFKSFDNIVVFDVETTGLYPNKDEIIEIAILRVANKEDKLIIDDELNILIQLSSGKSLPAKITELTGITSKVLSEEGVSKEEACNKITDIMDCSKPLLAAYNAQFDLNFLFHLLLSHNKADVLKKCKMLDVMTVFKDRRPYPHKLADAASAYLIEVQNAHRAYGDAHMTYSILSEMGKELDDLENYVNLFGFNPKYGISGKKISSIKYKPQGYDRTTKLYMD